MQALITLVSFLLTLGILVSFHEFGHFLAARLCGVRVLRFSLGFGKPLFTYVARNRTEWVVAAIPLGGYVKLLDGRDSGQLIPESEKSEAFDTKPLWQRSLIVVAGPLANFILAISLFAAIYMSGVAQLPARLGHTNRLQGFTHNFLVEFFHPGELNSGNRWSLINDHN